MKKNRIVVVLLVLLSFSAKAQNVNTIIDSLKIILKKKPDAKKVASIYSDLTWYYSNVSIDSALHYGGRAIQESKKLGDSTLLAQVYSDVGAVYFRKSDFQNSKDSYLTAYKIRKARKDYNGLAKININLASIYASKQQYQPAVRAYLEAIKYFESINNIEVVNATKENLGYIFREMKNYPKAIEYTNYNIQYAKENKLSDKYCISCLNMGNVYLEMKDTVKAMQFFNKSLKACKESGNKKGLQSLYNNIGYVKQSQSKSKEAVTLFSASQKVRAQFNSDLDQASLNLNLVKVRYDSKKYVEAKQMLLEVKKVFKANNSKSDLLLTYNLMIPICAFMNQPDSVAFYATNYAKLKEELLQTSVMKQTSELEAKYKTAKKEKLLFQKEAEAQHKNNLLIALSVLTFFIAFIGFLIYRQQKLKNKQQEQEFQLKSAIAQIETQNQLQEQRLSISRDLHDNIGAQLTFIISSVDNIKYAFDIQNVKLDSKLKSISNFTKATIIELRDTIWAMNSNEITFEDLRARILNFIEKAKEATDEIDFKFIVDERLNQMKLSSIFGMNVYRTIQEAVNNAVKYSEADQIAINIKKIDDEIQIAIDDNGIGFDKTTIEKGNGLINMEKRIEAIGGVFSLKSETNKGTSIIILIK